MFSVLNILLIIERAIVDAFVLGDELTDSGLREQGRTWDALGPQVPSLSSGHRRSPPDPESPNRMTQR